MTCLNHSTTPSSVCFCLEIPPEAVEAFYAHAEIPQNPRKTLGCFSVVPGSRPDVESSCCPYVDAHRNPGTTPGIFAARLVNRPEATDACYARIENCNDRDDCTRTCYAHEDACYSRADTGPNLVCIVDVAPACDGSPPGVVEIHHAHCGTRSRDTHTRLELARIAGVASPCHGPPPGVAEIYCGTHTGPKPVRIVAEIHRTHGDTRYHGTHTRPELVRIAGIGYARHGRPPGVVGIHYAHEDTREDTHPELVHIAGVAPARHGCPSPPGVVEIHYVHEDTRYARADTCPKP